MQYRQYSATNHTQLVDLWRTVFPDDPAHNEPNKVIAEKLKVDDLIFVAADNASIIGACMAGYDGHRGWLYAVAVHPSSRRGGVGTRLIEHTLAHLKSLGAEKVNLQIRSTHSEVEAFYLAIGFATEDRLSMGKFITA